MTYDNEAIVRHAYHTAEGSVLDVAGFVGSFANDGVINLGHAGIEPSGVGQESYAGIVKPTGAKVDGPCADFWYLRDGKIEMFNCYIMLSTMRAQMGVPERG
jgi:hypothetical protein